MLNDNVPQTFPPYITKATMKKHYEGDYYGEDLKIEFENEMSICIYIAIYHNCYSSIHFRIGNIHLEEMTKSTFIKFIKKISDELDESNILDFIEMLCVIQNKYFDYNDFTEGHIDTNFSFKPESKLKTKAKSTTDAIPKPTYTKKELNDMYTNLMKEHNAMKKC